MIHDSLSIQKNMFIQVNCYMLMPCTISCWKKYVHSSLSIDKNVLLDYEWRSLPIWYVYPSLFLWAIAPHIYQLVLDNVVMCINLASCSNNKQFINIDDESCNDVCQWSTNQFIAYQTASNNLWNLSNLSMSNLSKTTSNDHQAVVNTKKYPPSSWTWKDGEWRAVDVNHNG